MCGQPTQSQQRRQQPRMEKTRVPVALSHGTTTTTWPPVELGCGRVYGPSRLAHPPRLGSNLTARVRIMSLLPLQRRGRCAAAKQRRSLAHQPAAIVPTNRQGSGHTPASHLPLLKQWPTAAVLGRGQAQAPATKRSVGPLPSATANGQPPTAHGLHCAAPAQWGPVRPARSARASHWLP